MAFKDFADVQYIKTVDTGESPRLGSLTAASNGELAHIRVKLYINGTLNGSEQIRLKVYSDSAFQSLLYTSKWSNINQVIDENGNAVTGDWIGWIRIDFNRENVNNKFPYYIEAEFANYTRNFDTFYLGLAHDFPFPIYDNGEPLFYNHPLAMELFTYIERT